MLNLNNYIIEKLYLNKKLINNNYTSFKKGDIIFRFAIYLINGNTFLEINKPDSRELLIFNKYDNNNVITFTTNYISDPDKFSWENNKHINSNDYIEYSDKRNQNSKYYIVYLDKHDGLIFLERLLSKKESIKQIIDDYFDKNDNIKNQIRLSNTNDEITMFIKRLKIYNEENK